MVTMMEVDTMINTEKKYRRAKVSKQRQITIPKEFYDALNLTDETMIEFTGKEIILRPAEKEIVDFSTNILADLIENGYSGEELLSKFTAIKADIPNALKRMEEEAMKGPVVTDLNQFLDSLDEDDDDE